MKRFISILLIIFFAASVLTGCKTDKAEITKETTDTKAAVADDVYVVGNRMYATNVNELTSNYTKYLGRTVKIEGIFTDDYVYDSDKGIQYLVYRTYTDPTGCCNYPVGLYYTWETPPSDGDWLEVIGVLNTCTVNGSTCLTLDATSVTVMEDRGALVVSK